jgi:hypothetical protein
VKIAVLGNCQAPGFAAAIRSLLPRAEVQALAAPHITSIPSVRNYDIFFVQPPFAKRLDNSEYKCIRYFPVIGFTGFHPDCTYVFSQKKVVKSPVGDYHSVLVLGCYLRRLPIARVEPLFNKYIFEELGYTAEFERASQFLLKRAAAIGLDLNEALKHWIAARVIFMHTINHPVIRVLQDVARVALHREGLDVRDEAGEPKDSLASQGGFAVHPAVADRLGVDAKPYFRFSDKRAAREQRPHMPLSEYIVGSYSVYDTLPRETLMSNPNVSRVLDGLDRAGVR